MSKLEGKVLMAKVDIDDHTDLAIEYEVGGGKGQAFFSWHCLPGESCACTAAALVGRGSPEPASF